MIQINILRDILAIGTGLIACITDLKYRKIPNWLTFSVVIIGVIGNLILDHKDWSLSFLGIITGLLLLLIPFAAGGMGAGDVKLLMALGSLVGPLKLFRIFLLFGVAGGILAIIYLIYKLGFFKMMLRIKLMMESIWDLQKREMLTRINENNKLQIPYGVAVFIGIILEIVIFTSI